MSEKELLAEWLLNYVRSKDVIAKTIVEIKKNAEGFDFVVTKTTGNEFYLVSPGFEQFEKAVEKAATAKVCIIVLNTRENLEKLIKEWQAFSKLQNLCIIFANPNSTLDKKWMVYPFTHERITEKASLRRGLESIFSTVEPF